MSALLLLYGTLYRAKVVFIEKRRQNCRQHSAPSRAKSKKNVSRSFLPSAVAAMYTAGSLNQLSACVIDRWKSAPTLPSSLLTFNVHYAKARDRQTDNWSEIRSLEMYILSGGRFSSKELIIQHVWIKTFSCLLIYTSSSLLLLAYTDYNYLGY